MEMYGVNFVSKSRNVLLVTDTENTKNNSALDAGSWGSYYEVPYYWICGPDWSGNPYTPPQSPACTVSIAKAAASNWTVLGYHINYCLAQEVSEQCQLSFSLLIMLVVISVNASKACISMWISLASFS
jgi:hypothetical protein